MAKPGTPLPPWAQAGNYPASLYPLNLPWGDPNPVGGLPTPWSGQPRLNAAGLIAFANAGLTPQLPTPASTFNAWLSLSQEYAKWLEDGSALDGADAHVMETSAAGLSKALNYEATTSFSGAGATKAPLANGALVSDGQELELGGGANIAGGASTEVAVTRTVITERRWVDSATTLPSVPGRTRWNDTFYSVHDAAGTIHTFDEPARGYDPSHSTPNSIDSTGATCQRRVKHNEPIWIKFSARFEGSLALSLMNYRIQATGPLGTLDILTDTAAIDIINRGYYMTETLQWTPTDTWPGELAIQSYVFLVRMGTTGGTLTATRINVKAVSAVQV